MRRILFCRIKATVYSKLKALVESIKKKPKFFPERMRAISNWNNRGTQAFKKDQNMR
jgi:hypothetical protein